MMKRLLVLLMLLFTIHSYSQIDVRVFKDHVITVPDTLTETVLKRFQFYVEHSPINYEDRLRQIDSITIVDRNRYYVGELRKHEIVLNSRLDSFPNTKKVAILHFLYRNTGGKVYNRKLPSVLNTRFNITEYNENVFKRQIKTHSVYRLIIRNLEEQAKLKSKLN